MWYHIYMVVKEMKDMITRVDYRNPNRGTDFEIIDIKTFFNKRSHKMLTKDYRLNFWVIMYIVKGSGSHIIDFNKYDYEAGDVIFIHKNQVQRFIVNANVEGYIVHINEPFFYKVSGFDGDVFLEFADRTFGVPIIKGDVSEQSASRKLIELLAYEYSLPDVSSNIELIASFFQSFVLSLKKELQQQMLNDEVTNKLLLSSDYQHFKKYRELVEKNYRHLKQVEDYTKLMLVSKKTINQACRKVSGVSAKQYIIQRLVLEIKRYLSQGKLMNYEIADILGFEEPANMTKFFKHYVGISPKEFRLQLNNA